MKIEITWLHKIGTSEFYKVCMEKWNTNKADVRVGILRDNILYVDGLKLFNITIKDEVKKVFDIIELKEFEEAF